jgi:hypothetical protein
MKQYTIQKQKMNDLIKTILKKYRFIAPVEKDNITSFKEINKPDELTLNFTNSKIPPKSIFFPQMM